MPHVLEDRTTLALVVELAAAGKIRPSVEQLLPLSDFAKAQDRSQTGHARGKTVLVFYVCRRSHAAQEWNRDVNPEIESRFGKIAWDETGVIDTPRLSSAAELHTERVAELHTEKVMGKIRHIAIQVPDLERAATFYEGVFSLKRVNQVESPVGNAIALSDGIMNLTLLHFPEGTKGGKGGPEWAGLHHIGFVVEDEKDTAKKIADLGGTFFMQLPRYPGVDAERKYKDPDGIVFDVAEHDWRQSQPA